MRAAPSSYSPRLSFLARFASHRAPSPPKPVRSSAAAGDASKPFGAKPPPRHPSSIDRQPLAGHPNNSATRVPPKKPTQSQQQSPIQPRKYGEPLPTDSIPDLPPPSPYAGTPTAANSTTGDQAYPPQLLIYHAGKLPILLVSGMKFMTLLFSILVVLLYAPAVYYVPEYSNWAVIPVVAVGFTPLFITLYATYPLVTFAHICLPQWARLSRDRLAKYLANLPSNALLDITTLRWVWPRVTRLAVSELYIQENRSRVTMSLRRTIPRYVWDERKWWHWLPERGFFVWGPRGQGKTRGDGIWQQVLESVRKGWGAGKGGFRAFGTTEKEAELKTKLPPTRKLMQSMEKKR